VAERVPIGMMVEVPSAALLAHHFAREVDFLSIGTNDLTQYTMAAERTNPDLVALGDAASPAVLRLIQWVVEAAHAAGIWAGVCGEMAADPDLTPILLGLGVDELSMGAASIPRTKALVRTWSFAAARELAERSLRLESALEVRQLAASTPPH
jgi:phosphoenolpyruvate-protein kinase (PTS system EI component)